MYPTGSHAYSEKLVLFLEHIYTSGLKKSEETAAKEMVVALATQKAEELRRSCGAVKSVSRMLSQWAVCQRPNLYLHLKVQKWAPVS